MENDHLCKHYWNALNDYADERLSGGKQLSLEAHLRACARCRESLEGIQHLKQTIAREFVPEASPGFWEQCLSQVAARTRPRRLPLRVWGGAAALALTVIAAFIILGYLPITRPPADQARTLPPPVAVEVPDSALVLSHADSLMSQPLSTGAYYALLSARAQENDKASGARTPAEEAQDCDASVQAN